VDAVTNASPSPINPNPPPFPGIVYPLAHGAVGWGFLVALYLAVFVRYGAMWFWTGLVLFLVVIFVKETSWDPVHEQNQNFVWAGAYDLLMYIVGLVLAGGFLYALSHS